MRKVIIITLAFFIFAGSFPAVFADDVTLESVFTDKAFLEVVCEKTGIKDSSDRFSVWQKKIASVRELSLPERGIKSLSGIEYFTSLEILDISGNDITSLDLSSNVKLIQLIADKNPLSFMDLSENTALEYVYLQDCGIESIILPKSITKLFLQGNRIESLELSHLTNLTELNLKDNLLREINMSECKKLEYLWLDGNRLENIDLPDAEFETVILGTQRYTVGVKIERTYSPSWNILFSSVPSAGGKFGFTSEDLPSVVECMLNIGGYPMNVQFTAIDMRGDINSDDMVNSEDLSYVLYHYGSDDETADINKSGNVSSEDISVILSSYAYDADR